MLGHILPLIIPALNDIFGFLPAFNCTLFKNLNFCFKGVSSTLLLFFRLLNCTSNTSRHKPFVWLFSFLWGFYPAFFVRSSVCPEESADYSTSQCSTCLLILHLFSTFNIVAKVVCFFIDHTTCGQTAYRSKGWGANAKLKMLENRPEDALDLLVLTVYSV